MIKIACVGDSITFGYGIAPQDRPRYSYPAILQRLLGDDYRVANFGYNGATAVPGFDAYMDQFSYQLSLEFAASTYIIMLGTNDAQSCYWNAAEFQSSLTKLIKSYQNLPTTQRIYLMQPPVCYSQDLPGMQENINNKVVYQSVAQVADKFGLPVINLFGFTEGHPKWFTDGIHPNRVGNEKIAHLIYTKQKGDGIN